MSDDDGQRTLSIGRPSQIGSNNALYTSKYTLWNFLIIAVREQFRRNGNLYFLLMGCLMFIGTYTTLFDSSVSPWTTLGPLTVVLSVSITQEGLADWRRHQSDKETNNAEVVVLRNVDELEKELQSKKKKIKIDRDMTIMGGNDIEVILRAQMASPHAKHGNRKHISRPTTPGKKSIPSKIARVAFVKVKRMDLHAGDIVMVKNRDMVPADIILLGSSGENGAAYIETSPIDGETNLKLRSSPQVPLDLTMSMSTPRIGHNISSTVSEDGSVLSAEGAVDQYMHPKFESIERAIKRVTRYSLLGYPSGASALRNPSNNTVTMGPPPVDLGIDDVQSRSFSPRRKLSKSQKRQSSRSSFDLMRIFSATSGTFEEETNITDETKFVTCLTSEPPNASVNTFSGKITLPPRFAYAPSTEIPLNVENILLRGAFLRNTEWALGVACFTGADTKLARNSIQTPSKFSRLDELMNRIVILILVCMFVSVSFLAFFATITHSKGFDTLWYIGYNRPYENRDWSSGGSMHNITHWPYLPDLEIPEWQETKPRFHEFFFTYITLLNNYVPLSLYVTVEMVILFMMSLIAWDRDMYHKETDTAAIARSTIVTDLGQVKYIFSDKTGTLTQNVMNFKRCSVDGSIFGAPIKKSAPESEDHDHDHGGHDVFESDGNMGMDSDLSMDIDAGINLGESARNSKGSIKKMNEGAGGANSNSSVEPFHPLQRLMVGGVSIGSILEEEDGFEIVNNIPSDTMAAANGSAIANLTAEANAAEAAKTLLTFNAEMFLRVMSICHTVVVEKELDTSTINANNGKSVDDSSRGTSLGSQGTKLNFFNRSRNNTEDNDHSNNKLNTVEEDGEDELGSTRTSFTFSGVRPGSASGNSLNQMDNSQSGRSISSELSFKPGKAKDGSPFGYAYQAESPDEGALVSAASLEYGFQLRSRDTDGIKLTCSKPSLLAVPDVANGLRGGSVSAHELASATATPTMDVKGNSASGSGLKRAISKWEQKIAPTYPIGSDETWTILAVNKFDSDRKRMSILVRSPAHLGGIPILMCKGADSSMLDPEICEGGGSIQSAEANMGLSNSLSTLGEYQYDDGEENDIHNNFSGLSNGNNDSWSFNTLLNMQSHLGTFASEGLRTLVLGIRILTEDECQSWLSSYHVASTAIDDRDALLTAVAKQIETQIHIVGATAIEDQLQDGVPETIVNISKAGIKLWVLTGDKRETAIEIGYSTRVLNPKMHLTDVADGDPRRVKALVAMEFIRLVKMGKLHQYQRVMIDEPEVETCWGNFKSCFASFRRQRKAWSFSRRRFYATYLLTFCGILFKAKSRRILSKIDDEEEMEAVNVSKHKQVRELADSLIQEYLISENGAKEMEHRRRLSMDNSAMDFDGGPDKLPAVFNRASSARSTLQNRSGVLSESVVRDFSLASVTAKSLGSRAKDRVIDEETLSLQSFVPGAAGNIDVVFNKKKRTLLEKMFAVDRDVRKGNLVKHLTKEKKAEYYSNFDILPQKSMTDEPDSVNADIERALVIEGSALAHFLGKENEPLLEELLFSVASNCESVIACRVSPKQKALLVKLAKNFVKPTPVTLAIGDGANDVGMIQEAQVGVGISGLEGQQAVNSSDFAIAQFRYLETLLLVHGRWNFVRLSKVVLFSFYKNSMLACLLMIYSKSAYYSGIPLFDMWVLSAFNFVCGWPIFFLGMFDRDLEKEYVRENPHLYASGIHNEPMGMRVIIRWLALTVLQSNIIYYLCASCFADGGTQSSALKGIKLDEIGDGEGGGVKMFGTTVFVVMNWSLAMKVLFEHGSIINGKFPAFRNIFRKDIKEGFWSRCGYTWYGFFYLSIFFNFFFVYTYQLIGEEYGSTSFAPFVHLTFHMLHTRVITWVVLVLATAASTIADVSGKVFSNMFYPTQTQVHKEYQELVWKKERRQNERRLDCMRTHQEIIV